MTTIIIGASRGIGAYLFDAFEKQGQYVIGTYNQTKINREDYYHLDVTNRESVELFTERVQDKIRDTLNLIICCAVNYNGFAHKADIVGWEKAISVNLIGCFSITNSFLPIMRSLKSGRIIFLSSVVPLLGIPGTSAYSASKSALWGLSKTLAAENAALGITSNVINLGYYDIGMIKDVPDKYLEIIKSKIPTGKLGKPDNIWNAIQFIIKADYLTGSEINLNGGIL
jgi:NAD(P)-dependent dehydrogenase (short-subunit alcohol dehydrogenase family)